MGLKVHAETEGDPCTRLGEILLISDVELLIQGDGLPERTEGICGKLGGSVPQKLGGAPLPCGGKANLRHHDALVRYAFRLQKQKGILPALLRHLAAFPGFAERKAALALLSDVLHRRKAVLCVIVQMVFSLGDLLYKLRRGADLHQDIIVLHIKKMGVVKEQPVFSVALPPEIKQGKGICGERCVFFRRGAVLRFLLRLVLVHDPCRLIHIGNRRKAAQKGDDLSVFPRRHECAAQPGFRDINAVGGLKYQIGIILRPAQQLDSLFQLEAGNGLRRQTHQHDAVGGERGLQGYSQHVHQLDVIPLKQRVVPSDILLHLIRIQKGNDRAYVGMFLVKLPFRHICRRKAFDPGDNVRSLLFFYDVITGRYALPLSHMLHSLLPALRPDRTGIPYFPARSRPARCSLY